mmetsp:Transcript_49653/g.130612  ORF Transcript_49653/g.130612 Transcript_49653/m.130612 type:complete len:660 (+) Transcript_49653:69-2048(+)
MLLPRVRVREVTLVALVELLLWGGDLLVRLLLVVEPHCHLRHHVQAHAHLLDARVALTDLGLRFLRLAQQVERRLALGILRPRPGLIQRLGKLCDALLPGVNLQVRVDERSQVLRAADVGFEQLRGKIPVEVAAANVHLERDGRNLSNLVQPLVELLQVRILPLQQLLGVSQLVRQDLVVPHLPHLLLAELLLQLLPDGVDPARLALRLGEPPPHLADLRVLLAQQGLQVRDLVRRLLRRRLPLRLLHRVGRRKLLLPLPARARQLLRQNRLARLQLVHVPGRHVRHPLVHLVVGTVALSGKGGQPCSLHIHRLLHSLQLMLHVVRRLQEPNLPQDLTELNLVRGVHLVHVARQVHLRLPAADGRALAAHRRHRPSTHRAVGRILPRAEPAIPPLIPVRREVAILQDRRLVDHLHRRRGRGGLGRLRNLRLPRLQVLLVPEVRERLAHVALELKRRFQPNLSQVAHVHPRNVPAADTLDLERLPHQQAAALLLQLLVHLPPKEQLGDADAVRVVADAQRHHHRLHLVLPGLRRARGLLEQAEPHHEILVHDAHGEARARDTHGLHQARAAELIQHHLRLQEAGDLLRVGVDAPDKVRLRRIDARHQVGQLTLEFSRDALENDGRHAAGRRGDAASLARLGLQRAADNLRIIEEHLNVWG